MRTRRSWWWRRWGPAIAVCACCGLFPVAVWFAAKPSSHYQPCNSEQNPEKDKCYKEGNSAFSVVGNWIDRNRDDIGAASTFIIAMFTFTLWLATNKQARLTRNTVKALERSLIIGRSAADAAEKTANAALMALDRPWLYIETTRNFQHKFATDKQQAVAAIKIVNHGKAPALIISMKAALFYSPGPFDRGRDFPLKPLPATMKNFPTQGDLATFINFCASQPLEVGTRFDPSVGDDVEYMRRASLDNGIIIPSGDRSKEYFFRGVVLNVPTQGLPIEHAGTLYLIGNVIYRTPIDETEIITFTYEARGETFGAIFGPPYNERKKIK